jgi:hypothetical protein
MSKAKKVHTTITTIDKNMVDCILNICEHYLFTMKVLNADVHDTAPFQLLFEIRNKYLDRVAAADQSEKSIVAFEEDLLVLRDFAVMILKNHLLEI